MRRSSPSMLLLFGRQGFPELLKQLPAPLNGVKQPYGSLKSLTPRQAADLLGHSTSEITEIYYVKKDTARLNGITNGFEL